MGGIDPEIAALAPTLWVAAVAAALLVVTVCVLAFRPPPTEIIASAARSVIVLLAAVLCGSLVWAFLDSGAVRDRTAEGRALELRAGRLAVQSLAPGSPLACLDAVAGDVVMAACEKAVFASPASVAAAAAYVAAKFDLLADMTSYGKRTGVDVEAASAPLRRALEADPFGFFAHVLAIRDRCTAASCLQFKLLHDASRVRTDLVAQAFNEYVERYRDDWARHPEVAAADVADVQSTGSLDAAAPDRHKVKVHIDFPTAASIPPISIMNPEPKPTGGAAAETAHKGTAPGGGAGSTDPVWVPVPAQPAQ